MTLIEAKRRVLLAVFLGLAFQLITLSLLIIGLLASLTELPFQSPGAFNTFFTGLANFASRILSNWPGALYLAPIAPRYYPGQLDGNLAIALTILALAGATAIRNWGTRLHRSVKAVERQNRSCNWQQTARYPTTSVNVGQNFGTISIASPPAKDWSSRPVGIVLLAIVAGVAVEILVSVIK
ncbi:hypothetical protein AAV32_14985 [Kerstersia gyiorum]|uniref:Uncharacterized protein n=1 Tax=Kerstersia gyiorum TaxID=206506 RepID=A0A171KPH3_9BURK|nr:hypothetical protein AAV32_14985 [Kerstersia gyiorum]